MSRHVDRLNADDDLRRFDSGLLTAAAASGGMDQEQINEHRSRLVEQRGTVMRSEERRASSHEMADFEKAVNG